MFCDNDTNVQRLYGAPMQGHPKDAINDFVVNGVAEAVNPDRTGTKAAFHATWEIAPGGSKVLRARLRRPAQNDPFADFDACFADRIAEADEFYAALQSGIAGADAAPGAASGLRRHAVVQAVLWLRRAALAGGRPRAAARRRRRAATAATPTGCISRSAMSIPTSPATSCPCPIPGNIPGSPPGTSPSTAVAFALIDPAFAKSQLTLLTQSRCQHPNGQLPAYEWDFNDINPPVHAWAALQIYEIDRKATGIGDIVFLERIFHKLLLNFTWWVNSVDAGGRNIFQGGFLGLDNIGLFDMRAKLPDGAQLDQSRRHRLGRRLFAVDDAHRARNRFGQSGL